MTDAKRRVLLAGESWVSTATHIKGFDQFSTVTYHLGAEPLVAALKDLPFDLQYMPAHEAQRDFPQTAEALAAYGAVILSDIGSNTLLLHPETWVNSKPTPNRLRAIRAYVENGGGLLMVGGYYSFQGVNGGARYHGTPVEEILPVEILPYEDRVEAPESFTPVVTEPSHPILQGFEADWPNLLGFNEVKPKPERDGIGDRVRGLWVKAAARRRGLMARVERSRGPPTSGRTGCRLNLRRGPAMRGSGGNRSNG